MVTSSRKDGGSYDKSVASEYEQLERQRQNPHLYTTLQQCVNADGSITTFQQVTRKLQEAVDKLQEYHTRIFTGEHPHFCMKGMEQDVCKMIELHQEDIDKVQFTFVRNYHDMHLRIRHRASRRQERATGEPQT